MITVLLWGNYRSGDTTRNDCFFRDPDNLQELPWWDKELVRPRRHPRLLGGTMNIVRLAISIIGGLDSGQVARTAEKIGVSSATVYRWMRAGNLRSAKGAELLRISD